MTRIKIRAKRRRKERKEITEVREMIDAGQKVRNGTRWR